MRQSQTQATCPMFRTLTTTRTQTDRQTDRRTDGREAVRYTRLSERRRPSLSPRDDRHMSRRRRQ